MIGVANALPIADAILQSAFRESGRVAFARLVAGRQPPGPSPLGANTSSDELKWKGTRRPLMISTMTLRRKRADCGAFFRAV
eukprot:9183775-Pyramimonas_sp.AAC.1